MQPVNSGDLFLTIGMKLCGDNVDVRLEVSSMSKEADQSVHMYPATECSSMCAFGECSPCATTSCVKSEVAYENATLVQPNSPCYTEEEDSARLET